MTSSPEPVPVTLTSTAWRGRSTSHPDTPLLYVLRNDLGLTGARFGCGLGLCGACFVHVDGAVVASCDTPMWSVEGDGGRHRRGAGPRRRAAPVAAGGARRAGRAVRVLRHRRDHERRGAAGARAAPGRGAGDRGAGPPPVPLRRPAPHGARGRACGPGRLRAMPPEPAMAEAATPAPRSCRQDLAANPVLARWIQVAPDGVVDVRVGKVELGQGILTALAQIAADELDADLAGVRMLPADTAAGPDEGVTAGSLSVQRLRTGAAAGGRQRARPVRGGRGAALGRRPARTCGSSAGGSAARAARRRRTASWPATSTSTCPPTRRCRSSPGGAGVRGHRRRRASTCRTRSRAARGTSTTSACPASGSRACVRPPSRGAVLAAVDAAAAGDGVTVVRDGSFLAVAGPDEPEVLRAAERVRAAAEWDEHDSLPDEDDLDAFLRAGPHETDRGRRRRRERRPRHRGTRRGARLRATYRRPFLAHASMAPSCGVAIWHDAPDGPRDSPRQSAVDVWSHSQGIHALGRAIAGALGLATRPPSTCGTPRARAATATTPPTTPRSTPSCSRGRCRAGRCRCCGAGPDELAWSPFASAMVADVEATLDAAGRLASWRYDVYSQGHSARPGYAGVPGLLAATTLAEPAVVPGAGRPAAGDGAGSTRNALPGYDLPTGASPGTGCWRRRSAARRCGRSARTSTSSRSSRSWTRRRPRPARDPLEFRLAHLRDERGRRVLRLAAEAAGWGRPVPDGTGLRPRLRALQGHRRLLRRRRRGRGGDRRAGAAAVGRRRRRAGGEPGRRPQPDRGRRGAVDELDPQPLARHLVDHLAHDRPGHDARHVIALVHQLLDSHQPFSEPAAGVQTGEVIGLKALFDQDRHGQRVAERQHRGGAGCRHEIHRAGFFRHAAVERDVSRQSQRRLRCPVMTINGEPRRLALRPCERALRSRRCTRAPR